MGQEPAIEIQGLQRTYRSGFWRRPVVALRGLDLRVPEGTVFGFIGPNGAGKTTTIKVLAGLTRPDAGSVRVLGAPLGSRAARARLGFLPEQPYFYPHLRALEFLDFFGALYGLPASERRRRALGLLERVGLTEATDRFLKGFSKGMLQRIGMAQALIGDPDLVILDEPMSGLDPMGRALIRDIVVELKGAGKTIFFSTHILSDVEHLCDEMALLDAGTLVTSGRITDIVQANRSGFEVVAAGLEEPADLSGEGIGLQLRPPFAVFTASDGAATQSLIASIQKAGGRIDQVRSAHRSLEQIVVQALESRQGSDPEAGGRG
jgi:ABC-2 type transport system ATP-binding protein